MKPTTKKNELTPEEEQRRMELEEIIMPNLAGCLQVGAALKEMSDRRLYRSTHSSFKEYVESVYQIGVRTAYELVEHSEIVEQVKTECANFAQLATPNQTRELKKVEPEKRAKVIAVATQKAKEEGKPVTAKAIKEAAAEVCPKTLDEEAKKALAGVKLKNREQELAEHFHGFKVALGNLANEIPSDASVGDYLVEANRFAALISNRNRDQQNARAYTT